MEFSRTLDLEVNSFVQRLGAAVCEAIRKYDMRAVRDVVPALGGLALHFDRDEFDGDVLAAAAELVALCLKQGLPPAEALGRSVEVPVCYEQQFAPDMDEVCGKKGLSAAEISKIHSSSEYRVLMMGFAPGHAYLGGLDARLSVPRRATPRAVVPAGSVAIANEQTVIYPYAIPGGWSVIGRTPLVVFDAARESPSLFAAGDRVRFRAIGAREFAALAEKK